MDAWGRKASQSAEQPRLPGRLFSWVAEKIIHLCEDDLPGFAFLVIFYFWPYLRAFWGLFGLFFLGFWKANPSQPPY